jgi:NAD-dependent dihydropyrimidine dehydrogenase PreA subunit
MIELVSDSRCIKCDICVDVCPTNVFDRVPDEVPVLARQEDCQTCFMCEVYCPVDALYVAPQIDQVAGIDEEALTARGLLGSYRKAVGWGPKRTPGAAADESFRVLQAGKI